MASGRLALQPDGKRKTCIAIEQICRMGCGRIASQLSKMPDEKRKTGIAIEQICRMGCGRIASQPDGKLRTYINQ